MNDYDVFLSEQGVSDEFVKSCSEIELDRIDINPDGVSVKSSDIQGLGLFASKEYKSGDLIMPAILSGKRTEGGRYANHSPEPSASTIAVGNDVNLYAKKDINLGDEITTNYRDAAKLITGVSVARGKMADFEEALLELPQVDLPLQHHFADGIYGREMFVQSGRAFTGKIHKTEHMSILLSGEMLINSTTRGSERIIAPCMFISPANTKKAGFAVTDCVFMTIHGTHERNLDKIESELVSDSYLGVE